MSKVFDDYVGEAREQIKSEHPLAAQSQNLLEALSDVMGYQAWRAHRAYDHVDIVFGAKLVDRTAGYSLLFHEAPKGTPGRVDSIQLSTEEMRELERKIKVALWADVS